MKAYTPVSRKSVGEDHVAICPNFGCEYIKRVKPLKLQFLGFGKHPKCKKHHIPLVYIEERIVDFVDAALACLFDKAGLPPIELLNGVKSQFPDEFNSFVEGWVYCITVGRGASIVSRYMDTISNAYLKQLTKKQVKALKKGEKSKLNLVYKTIKDGMDEIAIQYARVLKHLRVHSEILNNHQKVRSLSKSLQSFLKDWQKKAINYIEIIKSPEKQRAMSLKEIKYSCDQILNVGICRCLLGLNPETKEIKKENITAFDRFNIYYELFNEGLTMKFTKLDLKRILENEKSDDIISNSLKKKDSLNKNNNLTDNIQVSKNLITEISEINISNFKVRVMNKVEELLLLISATENQKTYLLKKAEELLNDFILKTIKSDRAIQRNSNPSTYAATIIYAISVSIENMPLLTGREMAKLINVSPKVVNDLYNKLFKELAPKKNYNPQDVQLRNSRNIISLYFYESLLITKLDLFNLILHLRRNNSYEIVSHLGEIINNPNANQLTPNEKNLINQLTEEDIKKLQFMMKNYSDTFVKYFSDIVEIIKLLIISNKSHKIIGAVFSIVAFVDYLHNNNINLFMTKRGLYDVISDIFSYLKKTKYSKLFPAQIKSMEGEFYHIDKTGKKRQLIAGARIKIFVMKYIDNGSHYNLENGVIICSECLNEGFNINTNRPRIRSKEFHHKDSKFERYTAKDMFEMFTKNRGNPYFLPNLIEQIERESVVIKCGRHHSVCHDDYQQFNKLVNWIDIPKMFQYKDIIDLPAEIIHILTYICVEAYYQEKISERDIKEIKNRLIYRMKKRYIIEILYGGYCPICKEFNVYDHSRAMDYNHLYGLKNLKPEEREKRKNNRLITLFNTMSCSEIVREIKKKYHRGGYICHNCHAVIHTNLELVARIYNDPNILMKIRDDKEESIRKYKQNLISNTPLIKNPFKSEVIKFKAFMRYLIAIFKITRDKGEVSTIDLAKEMGITLSPVRSFFRRRKNDLERYGKIIFGDVYNPTRFYMNKEGKNIVDLLFYFKNFYENYNLS